MHGGLSKVFNPFKQIYLILPPPGGGNFGTNTKSIRVTHYNQFSGYNPGDNGKDSQI